jgi:hypothetical protein
MKLEKAHIDVLAGDHEGDQVPVMFNPYEYGLEQANTFKSSAIPGLSAPLFQFVNGEAEVLSLELFLDDYTDPAGPGEKSTQGMLDFLSQLMEMDSKLHAPSPVRFIWGKLNFTAIIEKMSRKVTLFQPDGTAARASVNVTFKEYKTLPQLILSPRLESADKTKRRVIVGHDSLWALANREYGDPQLWREIAQDNDLDDPRDIAPGDWVTLPALEDIVSGRNNP